MACSFLASCGSGDHVSAVAPPPPPNITQYVTGEAAAAVDEEGHFVLLDPPPSGGYPELSRAEAIELAVAFIPTFGRFFHTGWEREHRARIDLKALTECGSAHVAPVFESVPAEAPPSLRNGLGPIWLVTLCGNRMVPQVSVAVAGYATDMEVVDGRVMWVGRGNRGREFFPLGIPPGAEYPMTPERAVEEFGRQTDARITRVPTLIRPEAYVAAQHGVWRLVLDRPVLVRDANSDGVTAVREVYAGTSLQDPRRIAFYRAAATESTSAVFSGIDADGLSTWSVTIRRRVDMPLEMVPVILP